MQDIPNSQECLKILKKQGCSKKVIEHCVAVRDYAVRIAKKAGADVKLVDAGAMLHDVGRAKTHNIKHLLEGIKIAKEMNLSPKLIKIIERHIGAGITKEEAKKLGLPPNDYIPRSLEEKIVCHADNLIQNCRKHSVEKEVEKALKNGHKEYAIRLIELHKELSRICGIDLNKI